MVCAALGLYPCCAPRPVLGEGAQDGVVWTPRPTFAAPKAFGGGTRCTGIKFRVRLTGQEYLFSGIGTGRNPRCPSEAGRLAEQARRLFHPNRRHSRANLIRARCPVNRQARGLSYAGLPRKLSGLDFEV